MNEIINKYLLYYPAVFLRRQWVPFYLKQLKESQWNTAKKLQKVQFEKLSNLLKFAKCHIPYYQNTLKDIDLKSFTKLDDLQNIPVLTKELLKENIESLLCADYQKNSYKKTTGGSTGNPVTIYKSSRSLAAAYAAYWRGYGWAGVGIGDRQGRFWGMPHDKTSKTKARLTDIITNRLRCSAFAFSEEHLSKYYDNLNRFQPKYFYGYVSMLEAFAKYLIKYKLKLKTQLTCVITTSEVLTDTHRRLFEKAFDSRIFNEYGCGEVGTIAHECENGSLHISSENVIVEILKDDMPVKSGEVGDIVVTELNNTVMPLIRYNLKDLGYIKGDSCPCGRGLPILGGVIGRSYDIIYNKEQKAFHGEYFMYIFEELQNLGIQVSAFQVVQVDFENFIIKLVMSDMNNKTLENYIYKRVHQTYGTYAVLKFEYVDKIDREGSGKIRLIKSLITN